ncbi:glycosyltransferase family 2 protein [Rhizobium sp.]|uniref:glycosyltransferase family 2 protein n=1 Tax=Rhizobium sp. TaxID=391 RepID=UPI0034C6BCD8
MSNLQNVDLSGGPFVGRYVQPRLAVLIPCYNEEATIASVVGDFRLALPTATIYVYDNNSTDRTIAEAQRAGAVVRSEYRQGKGQVVRRMFADIDADCYILVDGDDTYSAAAAPRAIERVIKDSIDFVNIARISTVTEAYRLGHRFGNKMLTNMVRFFFGRQSSDMLSGYKVLSRRFVKSFPAMSSGFETETELTVHALEMRMPIAEISAPYKERPPGSFSKLSTFRDGWRILMLIARLIKDERPLKFFGTIGLLLCLLAFGLSVPLLVTYVQTGLVPRLPTAVLSVGLIITGFLTIFAGLILDVVTKARQEMKRMAYLAA